MTLKEIAIGALVAGIAAALVAGVVHFLLLQPVLLEAELYEAGGVGPDGHAHVHGLGGAARGFWTLAFYALVYVGWGLVLLAAMAAADERFGRLTDARRGALWGLAGFVAVALAPAAGLAPELPGTVAAELAPRQIWWFFCVGATAAALGLLAYGRAPLAWGAGVLLLLAPHLIGAPRAEGYGGLVPAELAADFAARSLFAAAVAWAVLGLTAGLMRARA